jgi:hypothetical protein
VREREGRVLSVPKYFAARFEVIRLLRAPPGSGEGRGGAGHRVRCDDYLRISYATSMANIEKGLDRIERFAKGLAAKAA